MGLDVSILLSHPQYPSFVIYFDIDSMKVTPVWGEDTLEVVSADWEQIKEYFK